MKYETNYAYRILIDELRLLKKSIKYGNWEGYKEELKKFEEIVKKAMGYSEDREDQITVSSISFANSASPDMPAETKSSKLDMLKKVGNYRKTIINLLLAALVFFLVIRPLMKSMKSLSEEVSVKVKQLEADTEAPGREGGGRKIDQKQQIFEVSQNNHERAQQLIKGWIGELE